jgi:hypothetical protein
MTNSYNGPRWEELLIWNNIVTRSFPKTDTDYNNSLWAAWVSRIQQGHDAEEVRLSAQGNTGHENDDGIDGHWQICCFSNYMFAAIIVAIWSEMEWLLKNITHISKKVLQSQDKKQKKCDFMSIITFFKGKLSIDLESLSSYKTFNAIRILNNSFKHHNLFYRPEADKSYDQIDPILLQEWGIIEDEDNNENEIDFSKVPIKNLILACADFCDELENKVKQEFDNRATTNININLTPKGKENKGTQ